MKKKKGNYRRRRKRISAGDRAGLKYLVGRKGCCSGIEAVAR